MQKEPTDSNQQNAAALGSFSIAGLLLIGGLFLLIFDKEWLFLDATSRDFSLGAKQGDEKEPRVYEAESPLYDIKICNNSKQEKIYASLGYYDPNAGHWVARGWFVAEKGSCLTPLKKVKPPIYAYAESLSSNVRWGQANATADFCIDRDNKYAFPRGRCRVQSSEQVAVQLSEKTTWQGFTQLNFSGKGGVFTWEIMEP